MHILSLTNDINTLNKFEDWLMMLLDKKTSNPLRNVITHWIICQNHNFDAHKDNLFPCIFLEFLVCICTGGGVTVMQKGVNRFIKNFSLRFALK